ncbi:MAG: GIDE domain-containing protein [Gammaproteobacteria bacterium]|nr:GIDE domain-containing protein [Gammaproteobacteria bacterium]MCW8972275.1 GIDE domain-containing protein [Gammaproteobacteria bacterium]MCW8991870.1 GIDE domain-containing protein [Gammaproteobacteria bacterium]
MFEAFIPAELREGVLQMQPLKFWLLSGFFLLLALGAFYGIFRFLHRARLIEDTPTSKVRSASQGYIELDGTAELMPGDPVLAPLTGTRCTWYSFKVEERSDSYNSRGQRRRSWKTIRSGTSDELFLLRDETGECVIDPEGAEVTPSVSLTWYGDSAVWPFGVAPPKRGLFSSGDYRFTEKRIQPADPLYAIGQFRSLGGGQELPDSREEVRQLLAVWKRDQAALLQRFDRDGDGEIDLQEWQEARRAAEQQVRAEQRQRAAGPVTHLLSKPRDGRRPYLLSVLPQDALASRYRRFAGGALLLFLLGGATATWMLSVRLLA